MAIYLKLYVVFVYLKLSIHLILAAITCSVNEGSSDFNGKVKRYLKVVGHWHIYPYRLTT